MYKYTDFSQLPQLTERIHHGLNVTHSFEDLVTVCWVGAPFCNLPCIIQNLMKGFISFNAKMSSLLHHHLNIIIQYVDKVSNI